MDNIKKYYFKIKKKIKHLSKNINYIHDKSGKLRIVLFFDILWCRIRYRLTVNEYRIYEYYNIKSNKRKTYMNIRKHKSLDFLYLDKNILNVLEDKDLFRRRFKDYIKNDLIDVNDLNFKEQEELCLNDKRLICRNKSGKFINTFSIYDIKDFRSPAYMINEIKKDKKYLVEKEFKQLKALNEISENLVIINVVTLNAFNGIKVIFSSIKYKVDKDVISGYIDTKNGKIKGNLKDKDGMNYKDIRGFEIPKFDKIISLSKKLAKEMEEIYEIEWSFIINSRGTVYLIDANRFNDFVFGQTPEFLNNRIGLLPTYKNNLKKYFF